MDMGFFTQSIVGHDAVRAYLDRRVTAQSLPATLLLCGPASVGKSTIARSVIAGFFCSTPRGGNACGACVSCDAFRRDLHPDAHVLTKDQMVDVDDVRQILHTLSLTPTLTTRRAVLIEHAEALNVSAENALLKTLEEPPNDTLIILCTTALEAILPTVRSRCPTLFFHSVNTDSIASWLVSLGGTTQLAKELAQLSAGRPGIALGYLAFPETLDAYRARLEQLLTIMRAPRERRASLLLSLVPKGEGAPAAARTLLDQWMSIGRDALLLSQHNEKSLMHRSLHSADFPGFSQEQLLRFLQRIREARDWLTHHVRPDLALAYCMVPL